MGCPSCEDELRQIKPYGDISGIGVSIQLRALLSKGLAQVIISFLLSAFLLVIYVLIYYLSVYDPDLDPYRPSDKPNLLIEIPNPVDRTFLRLFRRVCALAGSNIDLKKRTPSWFADRRAFEKALTKSARLVSDIQIFTALALLVSGFKAFSCDLQSYHWQIILYMAWLGSTSHMAVLSSLRNYLFTHRKQLWWRFGGMFVVATMLLVALGLTSALQSTDSVSTASRSIARLAKCTVPKEEEGEVARETLESKLKLAIFLGYGYGIRVLKLFKWFDKTPRRLSLWLRRKSIRIEDGHGETPEWDPYRKTDSLIQGIRTKWMQPLVVAVCRTIHVHLDLLTSFLAEVFWLIMSFTWAAMRLIRFRTAAKVDEENEWTFGQVFPVVLLIAPLAALMSTLSPSSSSSSSPGIPFANLSTDQTNHSLQPREGQAQLAQSQAQSVLGILDGDGQVVVQKADEGYESGASFQGSSVLASFTYINVAIFILTGDPSSPSVAYVVGAQLWSSAFLQPLFQISWPLYSLWIPRLKLGKTRTLIVLDFIFLTTFLLTVSVPSVQISFEIVGNTEHLAWADDPHGIIKVEIWGGSGLLVAYLIFFSWFRSALLVERIKTSWLQLLCRVLVSLFSSMSLLILFIPYLTMKTMREHISFYDAADASDGVFWGIEILYGAGCVFVCQLLVGLSELAIQRWARSRARDVRACLLMLIMALILAWLYHSYHQVAKGLRMDDTSSIVAIPVGSVWLLSVVVASEAWFAFWICGDMVSIVHHRRLQHAAHHQGEQRPHHHQ